MPSFLITDILSHESQTKVSKISSEYATDHESSSVSPSLTPSSPSLDASAFIILSRYLNRSPSSLTDNFFPMIRTHCVENNRTDKKRHTCNKDESWKTHSLIDSLYKQTCFLAKNSDRSANESRENFGWPIATFPLSGGAFHPVRRTPISNDLLSGQHVRNSSIHGSEKGQQTDGLNTSRAKQRDFTVSSLQILKNRESGRSVFSYGSEHEPVTVHTDSADSEELILRGLENSGQCSGEDESAAKCPRSSPYGNNSALDALIHMTASSMQRLDRKVDKPTSQTDRLELCSINRGNQMTKRRKTRTTFSNSQLSELENNFNRQKYLTPNDRDRIAKHLGLSNTQVITWFQNRRAKLKREAEELERDILAARQQEQQKFLELHSQESEDGTTNCVTENFIPEGRWNPPMKNQIHVNRTGEISNFKTRFSKSRRDLPSPNHWSDSSSISIPLNTKNNINEDDDEDDDEAIQPSTDDRISNTTARKVALTVTRIVSSRKKSVWSPAGELEMSIS
ncbi:Transcription factor LBX1 [Fasciola gigantica]|uniref:Transcription factor LBX1 n=1 Tax=Fasciola gigantica TaxID=46835 RepID=A0A504YD82_FASGI|nr:Transcription factor LBX1 [Fasciola gigantica]